MTNATNNLKLTHLNVAPANNAEADNRKKTVEQLKAELAAAQEQVAAAERAEREAAREAERAAAKAKEEAAEQARADKVAPHLGAIHAALVAAGVETQLGRFSIRVGPATASWPDPDLQIGVEREEHSSSGYSWRSSYTGRHVLTVGDRYRDHPKVRYPELKAGGWNTAKIVATVLDRISNKNAATARKQKELSAKDRADMLALEVRAATGLKADSSTIVGHYSRSYQTGGRGSGYRYEEIVAPEGLVYAQLGTMAVTPEQAAVLVAALTRVAAMGKSKKAAS